MGGISEENYLSMRSGKNIFQNIDKNRYNVRCLRWLKDGSFCASKMNTFDEIECRYKNIKEVICSLKIDVIFNALHGNAEGDGKLNGLMELLGMHYTGNRFYTDFTGMNKIISKLLFQHLKILTPKFIVLNGKNFNMIKEFTFPCVIKPVSSGSSSGVKQCMDLPSALQWLKVLFKRGIQNIMVEKYMQGQEYSVGILGKYSLPDSEKIIFPVGCIHYDAMIFDDRCKFNNEYYTAIPSGLSNSQKKKLKNISLAVHNFFEFNGISRTDFLITDNGIYLLEVNTHPGLAPHSIISAMIEESTLTFSRVIDLLIESAC